MDLIFDDLQKLYGDRFFLVPGDAVFSSSEANSEPLPEAQTVTPVEAQVETAPEAQVETTPEAQVATPVERKDSHESPPSSEEVLTPTGKLTWRPKPQSQVLFILHASELGNRELTDLLKKIVASIEIPFDAAGFGVITGEINAADFRDMPNPYGVVFDNGLIFGDTNPTKVPGGQNIEEGTLYFTHRLAELKDDRELKKALWEQLQEIQQKLV